MPKRHRAMPGEIKFSFNREGKYSRHYALTRIAVTDGYNVVVNNHLCPQSKYDQSLTSQRSLGLELVKKMMKANKAG
jgi:hypothetical protein